MSKAHLDLLIVEDEAATRSALTQIFAMRGHRVRAADDGFAALRLIRGQVPDVLLSDLNMPGMSGFELLSVVRRLYPQIHVIATSGAYSGTLVPPRIAADGFYEKATGMERLFELMAVGQNGGPASAWPERVPTPLWVDLERHQYRESSHALLNCPQCLRSFRQPVEDIHPNLRECSCHHCGEAVSYAIALAVKPLPMATPFQESVRCSL